MSDIILLFSWIGTVTGEVFDMLDSVDVLNSGYTYLDFMIASWFIGEIVWFLTALTNIGDD